MNVENVTVVFLSKKCNDFSTLLKKIDYNASHNTSTYTKLNILMVGMRVQYLERWILTVFTILCFCRG